jgi:hypothetical protein
MYGISSPIWCHILGFGYPVMYLCLSKSPLLFSPPGFFSLLLSGLCSLFSMPKRISLYKLFTKLHPCSTTCPVALDPAEAGSGDVTCPMAPDPTTLLMRASVLPRVAQIQILSPYSDLKNTERLSCNDMQQGSRIFKTHMHFSSSLNHVHHCVHPT